MIKVDEKKVN